MSHEIGLLTEQPGKYCRAAFYNKSIPHLSMTFIVSVIIMPMSLIMAAALVMTFITMPLCMLRVAGIGKVSLVVAVTDHSLIVAPPVLCILSAIHIVVHPWCWLVDNYFIAMIDIIVSITRW